MLLNKIKISQVSRRFKRSVIGQSRVMRSIEVEAQKTLGSFIMSGAILPYPYMAIFAVLTGRR